MNPSVLSRTARGPHHVRACLRGALGVAVVFLSTTGCVTLNKHNFLRERVEVLERERDVIQDRLDRAERRIENLNTRVKEWKEEIMRGGADQGATIDELRTILVESGGRLEEIAYRTEAQRQQLQAVLDALDERFGISIGGPAQATDLPEDKGALLQAGRTHITQGQARKARVALRAYLQRFPKDEQLDEVQLLIAESYFVEGKHDLALREFQTLHDQYPKSALVPKALWRIVDCLEAQRQCKKAQAVLKYLQETQRKSAEAGRVPERLREMKKTCP